MKNFEEKANCISYQAYISFIKAFNIMQNQNFDKNAQFSF